MTEQSALTHLDTLMRRHPALQNCRSRILEAYELMRESYRAGGKLLIAGNGGSAADADHIVGELMKGFLLLRPLPADLQAKLLRIDPIRGKRLAEKLQRGLPALHVCGHTALSTAYINDCDPLLSFAQQIYGYGRAGDVFLGISTSGNSTNVLYAAVAAKALDMKVIGLTGENGGALSALADVCVQAPGTETYQVQEAHLPIYHCWCMMLEASFFEPESSAAALNA